VFKVQSSVDVSAMPTALLKIKNFPAFFNIFIKNAGKKLNFKIQSSNKAKNSRPF